MYLNEKKAELKLSLYLSGPEALTVATEKHLVTNCVLGNVSERKQFHSVNVNF